MQEHGEKAFIVQFPSKAELERIVAICTITTKNREGVLIFEEFDAEVKPIKVLDQVWLSVTNVPTSLRAFLPLWAVGSVVGATQKVDMHHLRQTVEVRILVAVFDIKDIQKQASICVNRSIYRLYIKVVEVLQDDSFNPEDVDLLGDDADDGHLDDTHQDDSHHGFDGSGDHAMEDATADPAHQNNASNNQLFEKTTQIPNAQQQGA